MSPALLLGLVSLARAAPPPPVHDGQLATEDDYPMGLAVLVELEVVREPEGSYLTRWNSCSATRIAPDVVLTAAHCLEEAVWARSNGGYEIRNPQVWFLPDVDVTPYEYVETEEIWLPERALHASSWVLHPDYDGIPVTWENNHDLGLAFLDTADVQAPLSAVVAPGEVELVVGLDLELVGWGRTSTEGDPGIKYWGELHLTQLLEGEFGAGDVDQGDATTCKGDSGGPAFARVEGSLRQVGIVSHTLYGGSSLCGEDAFTDVEVYQGWIDAAMREACADGSRVWCEEEGVLPAGWAPAGEDTGEEGSPRACGCAAVGLSAGPHWLLPALLGWRRRRRGTVSGSGG